MTETHLDNKAWKRGDPMPQTIKQFQLMGDMYEEGFLKLNAENAKLRSDVNDLRNKTKGQYCTRAQRDDCGEIV